jgi:hypothetical protein
MVPVPGEVGPWSSDKRSHILKWSPGDFDAGSARVSRGPVRRFYLHPLDIDSCVSCEFDGNSE